MQQDKNTAAMELPEITEENVAQIANAYAESQLGELNEPHRNKRKADVKVHWCGGFLAHAQLFDPHYAELQQKFEEIYDEVDKCRNMLGRVYGMFAELEKIDLPTDANYEILQCTEHLKMLRGEW